MMMTKTLRTIVIIGLAFSLTGCMTIVQSIVGIRDTNRLSDSQIEKASGAFKVDQKANYRLDTTYWTYIVNLDKTRLKAERKNHMQPMQALYFDSQGKLVKFYINCYAGRFFPNIKWNRNGNLENFLPKDQAPVDTILDLKKQVGYLRPVCPSTPERVEENQDYYVFIYWNKSTKRHSKRLIKSIKNNVSKAKNTKVKIIYVNYDNIFYELEHVTPA
jgi:hypothetical protein